MLKRWFFRVVFLTAMAAMAVGAAAAGDGAPRIAKEDLEARLGAADMSIIDVRAITDWWGSRLKIKGAIREDPNDVDSWASRYPKDRTLILYCD